MANFLSRRRPEHSPPFSADTSLADAFDVFSKDKGASEKYIDQKWSDLTELGWTDDFFQELARESQITPEAAYPSQGLVATPYDGNGIEETEDIPRAVELDKELLQQTVQAWLYYLELFNHPARLESLLATQEQVFKAPQRVWFHPIFVMARLLHRAISVNELALHIPGSDTPRIKRTERFMHGPFVKFGRYSRSILVGSANPDMWGNAIGVASLAQSHCLAGIPRDGFFSNIQRQADYARKVLELIRTSPVLVGRSEAEQQELTHRWEHNVMGVLEATPEKAIKRATALYEAGVRTFRIYSPEPGDGPLETLKALQRHAQTHNWDELEIFAGQVTNVKQAQQLQAAGATGIYIGIGGGGRCTTGVRSNSAIDWPQLLWELRGRIKIPVIVEGGATDNIGTALALGATGIGVTRAAAGGTIESPGGWLYFLTDQHQKYKPYGGEASARMKSMGGRGGFGDSIPYVEGESTKALMEYGRGNLPTMMQKLYLLFGDTVMNLVFQSVETVEELQTVGPRNLRLVSSAEQQLRHPH